MSVEQRLSSGLAAGQRIGKYEIVRRIGEGGMATIYLARLPGPGGFEKTVALKVLRPEYTRLEEAADFLLHEARVAAALDHPNIVPVYDLGRSGDEYFMAMEWVNGTSLFRLLSRLRRVRATLPLEVAVYVGQQIAEALAYLRQGVVIDGQSVSLVHRDVSPSNVLLSTSGAAKLADFGIVKVLEYPAMTRVGVVKGKYAYMSPEQLRGDAIDHRSDLFALGVVLFEVLTSRRLFLRKTLASTVAAAHAARTRPPSDLNPAVPRELDRVVLRALAKDPADRYPDAESLAADLMPFTSIGCRSSLAEIIRSLGEEESPYRGPSEPEGVVPTDDPQATSLEEFRALEADLLAEGAVHGEATLAGEPDALLPTRARVLARTMAPEPSSGHALPMSEPVGPTRDRGALWALAMVAVTLSGIGVFWSIVLS